jgi:hypothetical protein
MSYNGHKNYNCWNVSLWINNDEGLYRLMKDCLRLFKTKDLATFAFLSNVDTHTPDGVRYTFASVRKAISGDF